MVANIDKPAYVGYCEESKKYYGYHGNMIKNKRYAMRLVKPDRFVSMGLKPIELNK